MPSNHLAVAKKNGTKMEPWQVDPWTKTCGLPLLVDFEPHPFKEATGFLVSEQVKWVVGRSQTH